MAVDIPLRAPCRKCRPSPSLRHAAAGRPSDRRDREAKRVSLEVREGNRNEHLCNKLVAGDKRRHLALRVQCLRPGPIGEYRRGQDDRRIESLGIHAGGAGGTDGHQQDEWPGSPGTNCASGGSGEDQYSSSPGETGSCPGRPSWRPTRWSWATTLWKTPEVVKHPSAAVGRSQNTCSRQSLPSTESGDAKGAENRGRMTEGGGRQTRKPLAILASLRET
jgi:hypothetical protein